MAIHISTADIFLRLLLSALAGIVLGSNRSWHTRPAGLRTIMLVCLAASIAMVEANLLMTSEGQAHSFIVLDVMRLPLGILTGIGFICAGSILRKGNRVRGLTTAATIWIVTVIGGCFGAGQFILGAATTVLTFIILSVFKFFETRLPEERRAELFLSIEALEATSALGVSLDTHVRQLVAAEGHHVHSWDVTHSSERRKRHLQCRVVWMSRERVVTLPPYVKTLAALPQVETLKWSPEPS